MHLHNWPLHLWFLYSLIFWLNLIRHRMGHWAGSCIEPFLFGSIALSRRLWEWEECGAMCRYRVLRQLFFLGSAATWSKHTLHQIVLPAVICQRVYERIPALIREMSEGDGEREREHIPFSKQCLVFVLAMFFSWLEWNYRIWVLKSSWFKNVDSKFGLSLTWPFVIISYKSWPYWLWAKQWFLNIAAGVQDSGNFMLITSWKLNKFLAPK
jgi:hypothetical protein